MSETSTQTLAPQQLSTIVHRMALPSLLFSGSLFGLLLLSYLFLLPAFTRVERPDGVAMSPRAIVEYERSLAADLTAAEEHRLTLVRPVDDEQYRALVESRMARPSPAVLEEQLRQAAARLGEAGKGVVLLRIAVDGDDVTVEGDVRNVGLSSMTVLAAYIDEVEPLPFVSALQRPPFIRETAADGSVHSPFTLRFILIHP
jgi:hypothetical protein